jgi:hypothetical protein
VRSIDGMDLLDQNFDGYALKGQRGNDMRVFVRTLVAIGLLTVPSLISATTAATPVPCTTCGIRGIPAPIAGAGLPLLLIAGGLSAYWLVRRKQIR